MMEDEHLRRAENFIGERVTAPLTSITNRMFGNWLWSFKWVRVRWPVNNQINFDHNLTPQPSKQIDQL